MTTEPNGYAADEFDRLYEQYGKPLEAEHWGKFVVITPDGRTIVGDSLLDVAERATAEFGLGHYAYKIGERAVGRL